MRRACAVAVCALLTASGCSLQLLGAPTGHLTLTATFENVNDLTTGHTVQVANVVIGSVTHVGLDGYRAKVTMSLGDGHRIPSGTTATLRRTSLLGEPYVDLTFPPAFDPANATYLTSGSEITRTSTEPSVEDLAGRAGAILSAVSADDLAATVQAAAEALSGNGPQLHHLVAQLDQLVAAVGGQRENLGATIDNLGRLGAELAPFDAQIGALVDDLSATTVTVRADTEKFFTALSNFDRLATTTNDVVLQPHAQQFTDLLREADTILGSLAQHRSVLSSMADSFAAFVSRVTQAVRNGQLLVFTWIDTNITLNGTPASSAVPAFIKQLVGG